MKREHLWPLWKLTATSTAHSELDRPLQGIEPTAHWNKSRDPVVLPEKLRLRRKLHPVLQHLTV